MSKSQSTVLMLLIVLFALEAARSPVVKGFLTNNGPWGQFVTAVKGQGQQPTQK